MQKEAEPTSRGEDAEDGVQRKPGTSSQSPLLQSLRMPRFLLLSHNAKYCLPRKLKGDSHAQGSSQGLVPAVPLPNRSQKPRLSGGKPVVSTEPICTQSRHREPLLALRESFMSDKELSQQAPSCQPFKVAVSVPLQWLFL